MLHNPLWSMVGLCFNSEEIMNYHIIFHSNLLIEVVRIKGNKTIYKGYDLISAYSSIVNDLGGKVECLNGV